MRFRLALATAAIGLATMPAAAMAAASGPVTDCPLRDAPFSVRSPLVDALLNPQARAVIEKASGRSLSNIPARFAGTEPPTFAAILTVEKASMFTGLNPAKLPQLDAELRQIPVTDKDRLARCARYDDDVPVLEATSGNPRILLFEKINGFRDEPSVNAAHALFIDMAKRKGWSIAATEKAGAINARTLKKFDVVIWNNVSGDVLTLAQREALKTFLGQGKGFVAVHGSAGDPAYFWDWYADELIGARFIGHPMAPQFQEARIAVNAAHPLASVLPAEWKMTDEWYSFSTNPRTIGANVLLTLDESTYSPVGPMNADLRMGDHPLAWTNCVGPDGRKRGRMFYSAIGHRPETYTEPHHVALLEAAIDWAATAKSACPGEP